MAVVRRRDKNNIVLRKGECQRSTGSYSFRWTDKKGVRHDIYGKTLDELREKEKEIIIDEYEGIKTEAKYTTVNDMYKLWIELKRGIKNNTFENYKYMYKTFVYPNLGTRRIQDIKKSDLKRYYNYLVDNRGLKPGTLDSINTVIRQIFDMAVEDDYIRKNPSDNVLKELKRTHYFGNEKKRGLTIPEQELFLEFLKSNHTYSHWYPIFAVMMGTGMRVGEITGLRWCDIDLEEKIIYVNHTLVYYSHSDEKAKNGSYYNVNSPKTEAGNRTIPMIDSVKEAFLMEQKYQEQMKIKCNSKIDGYTDFIFLNKNGCPHNQQGLNKAIRRIIRDCNDAEFIKDNNPEILLPPFSCHSLRHTFTTRMCEVGVNIKVIQDVLGHKDITTTLNIYTDATKELKQKEFEIINTVFKKVNDL